MYNKKILIIFIAALFLLFIFLIENFQENIKKIKIYYNMTKIQETIIDNNYDHFNCSSNEISKFCNNIKKLTGNYPVINTSNHSSSFCSYIKISENNYFCVDNIFNKELNFIPTKKGFCNEENFNCFHLIQAL